MTWTPYQSADLLRERLGDAEAIAAEREDELSARIEDLESMLEEVIPHVPESLKEKIQELLKSD